MPPRNRKAAATSETAPSPPHRQNRHLTKVVVLGAAAAVAAGGLAILSLLASRDEEASAASARRLADTLVRCLAQCIALPNEARKEVLKLGERAAKHQTPWRLPPAVCEDSPPERRCDVLREAFCAGMQCKVNDAAGNLKPWVPLTSAIKPPPPDENIVKGADAALAKHAQCSSRCAASYLEVQTTPLTRHAVRSAAAVLRECGVVHLVGGAWPGEALDRLRKAAKAIKGLPPEERVPLRKDLRSNRSELFLPFETQFAEDIRESAAPLILAEYIGEPFALDYVSVLDAPARIAGAQALHPDVPFFPRTSISVHTALEDITAAMGPTVFCPCTHSVTGWEDMPRGGDLDEMAVSLAVIVRQASRTVADRARCPFGSEYIPQRLPAGTVTIYDGAVLHAGLANTAAIDRPVLNVNFAAPAGYEVGRNYTEDAPWGVNQATERWRKLYNGYNGEDDEVAAGPSEALRLARLRLESLPEA
eukprot:gnl/TRDRNA2_/TRDRNA2_128557_c0_seq1.p1 gnl/TRDRNA2_/TRDRNA2_128557_c0~~gnl/TRDRNA2_/TRDRNA2_128557_c0_seq1.p1  ORF type:complete len:477 (+),score=86.03 gnl/TRDRNA2_/TRDRNA2_128557_c0_seq1:55-1485(+)